MKLFIRGLKSGIPIGLGYLSVSFSFGLMAVSIGLTWWQALLISMTTLTSAGQLAGINAMSVGAPYSELLISQLTINIRYSFMSVSLAQKAAKRFSRLKRFVLGFFMTDEIFAVASAQNEVSTVFFLGLSVIPYIGWSIGTLLGAVLGNIMPETLMNSLCFAIYAMFIAIVAPNAKKSLKLFFIVAFSAALSCVFFYLPIFGFISDGLAISVSAVVSAILGALLFPIKEESENE